MRNNVNIDSTVSGQGEQSLCIHPSIHPLIHTDRQVKQTSPIKCSPKGSRCDPKHCTASLVRIITIVSPWIFIISGSNYTQHSRCDQWELPFLRANLVCLHDSHEDDDDEEHVKNEKESSKRSTFGIGNIVIACPSTHSLSHSTNHSHTFAHRLFISMVCVIKFLVDNAIDHSYFLLDQINCVIEQ